MITYEQVIAHVGLVATILLRTLQVVCVVLVAAALTTFLGFALADDWQQSGLLLGAVLGGGIAVAAFIEIRFAQDIAKAKRLPEISREEWAGAARQVVGRAVDTERTIVAAKGHSRLWRFVKGLWALKADIETLADGGLAPAASLGKAVVPSRLLTVAVIAVAAPFLLAFGLFVVVLAVVMG